MATFDLTKSMTNEANDDTGRKELPEVTLLIENPRKSTNWGPLLRCCAAFGISQIFVVGYDKCSVQGSHGASKHVELVAFPTHASAQAFLNDLGFELLGLLQGVTITNKTSWNDSLPVVVNTSRHTHQQEQEDPPNVHAAAEQANAYGSGDAELPCKVSFPLHSRPFSQRTCLVVGKRATGLPLSLAKYCHKFVHIPHQGLDPSESDMEDNVNDDEESFSNSYTAWLTVEACVSIVLHEFAMWAGYDKASSTYQGQKYHVQRKIKGRDTLANNNDDDTDDNHGGCLFRPLHKNESLQTADLNSSSHVDAFLGGVFENIDDTGDY